VIVSHDRKSQIHGELLEPLGGLPSAWRGL
jgi:hypothetical protein